MSGGAQPRKQFASKRTTDDMRSSERRPASNSNRPPVYGASLEDFEFGQQYKAERARLLGAVSVGQGALLDQVVSTDPALHRLLSQIYADPTTHTDFALIGGDELLRQAFDGSLPEGVMPVDEFMQGLWQQIDADAADYSTATAQGIEPVIPPATPEQGGTQ